MWMSLVRATVLSLLASLGVVSVIFIVGFIVLPATGEPDVSGQAAEIIVGMFGLLAIVLPFAIALCLPAIIILGGAMALATKRWNAMRTPIAWIISGLFGAAVTWYAIGGPGKEYPDDIIFAGCAGIIGIVAALVFRKSWVNPTVS